MAAVNVHRGFTSEVSRISFLVGRKPSCSGDDPFAKISGFNFSRLITTVSAYRCNNYEDYGGMLSCLDMALRYYFAKYFYKGFYDRYQFK